MLSGTLPETAKADGVLESGGKAASSLRGDHSTLNPALIGLLLMTYASLQVVSFTCFRLADFRGFSMDSIGPLMRSPQAWLGVLAAGGSLMLTFALVRISDTSVSLVLLLYINGIIVSFLLLPLTWKYVFGERIFTSTDRVFAFGLALASAATLLFATYLWNRGG